MCKVLPCYGISIGILLLLTATEAFAANDSKKIVQRARFIAAELALKNGNSEHYESLKRQLTQYPLFPYLEYQELSSQLNTATSEQVQDFINTYDKTPVASKLRVAWLNYLARQSRWKEYLQFYNGSMFINRQCYYLTALIETGQYKKALPEILPLWLSGNSQPDACDPVFEAWQKDGKLTDELVWQRIELALDEKHVRLAKHLARYLDSKDRPLLDLMLKVYLKPKIILKDKQVTRDLPVQRTILLYGVKSIARDDPEMALEIWESLVKSRKYHFSKVQQTQVKQFIAIELSKIYSDKALGFLKTLPAAAENKQLRQWRIRVALSQGDWGSVLKWTKSLPADEYGRNWQYWHAVAVSKQVSIGKAEPLFKALAKSRDYYAFLAADRIQQAYDLGAKKHPREKQDMASMRSNPDLLRVEEFYRMNRLEDARREWNSLSGKQDDRQLQYAAKIAYEWGWHDRVIIGLAKAQFWHDLSVSFPLVHQQLVLKITRQLGVEPAWVFAVMRQESAFIQDAKSGAGALGLMQLMPRTAKQVAGLLKKRLKSDYDLLQADANITLGSAYLRMVLGKLNNHRVLATAAYNAGPYRVKTWLPNTSLPADIWVEMIPYGETREYVRQVLCYSVIYEHRLGLKHTPLSKRMPPIEPRT